MCICHLQPITTIPLPSPPYITNLKRLGHKKDFGRQPHSSSDHLATHYARNRV